MQENNVEASLVFMRWQVQCKMCGTYFYVDTAPNSTEKDFIYIDEMKCGEHPIEDHVLELA